MVNRRDLSFKRGPSPKVHHEHNWPYDVLDQSHDDISMSDQSHCSSGQPVSMGIGVNWVSEADDEGSSSMAAISCDDYSSDLTEDETIPSDVANQITFVQTSMEYAATLWQFLLELLLGGGGIPDNLRQLQESPHHKIIAWTNMGCDPESPKYGEFKLIDSETVAMLWGRRKNKPRMNYDKLSRALRYYYEKDIIRKVSGQKFVYQFGRLPDREHQLLLNETFRNSSSPHMTVVSVGGDPIAANGQRYLYVPIKRLSPESGDDGAIKVEDQPLPDINNHNQPSTSAPDPEMTSGHMPLVTAAALLNMRPAIDPALIMRSYAQYMRCILEARSASSSSSTGVRADIKMEALDYSAGAGMDVKVEPDEYTNVDSSNIKTDSVFNDETVDENDEYGDLCIDQSDSAENDCEIDVKRCHQDFSPGDSRPYQNSDQKNVPISKPGDVITLWQFLLEQLIPSEKAIDGDLKPLSNLFGVEELESDGRVMVWTSPDHANPMSEYFCEFRISDPDKLAAMWGARKNTPRMNYEKMARSLRFYYKKGILRKVRGQKFVYQFTKDEQQRIIVGKTASDCGVVDQQEVSQSPLSEVDQQTTKFV